LVPTEEFRANRNPIQAGLAQPGFRLDASKSVGIIFSDTHIQIAYFRIE